MAEDGSSGCALGALASSLESLADELDIGTGQPGPHELVPVALGLQRPLHRLVVQTQLIGYGSDLPVPGLLVLPALRGGSCGFGFLGLHRVAQRLELPASLRIDARRTHAQLRVRNPE